MEDPYNLLGFPHVLADAASQKNEEEE